MTHVAPPSDEPAFVVRLAEFAGPLDLLLTLIREQEIDITDIPISQIADQFAAVIHQLGLNQAADYLDMAARLLRIKVQMLLPRPLDDEEWEDPRAELVRRLLEYEQIREVVGWLVDRATLRADRFGRGWMPEAPERVAAPIQIDLAGLLRAVEDLLRGMPPQILHRVVPRPLDVEGATRRIEGLLADRETFDLREAFGAAPTVADVISTLLAILELARLGRVHVVQSTPFSPVNVNRGSVDQAA